MKGEYRFLLTEAGVSYFARVEVDIVVRGIQLLSYLSHYPRMLMPTQVR